MYHKCRHSSDSFSRRTYTSTGTRKWALMCRELLSTARIRTIPGAINRDDFTYGCDARSKSCASLDLFAIDARKRSIFILSKHSLFAEKQMKKSAANYRKRLWFHNSPRGHFPLLLTVAAEIDHVSICPETIILFSPPRAQRRPSSLLFPSLLILDG